MHNIFSYRQTRWGTNKTSCERKASTTLVTVVKYYNHYKVSSMLGVKARLTQKDSPLVQDLRKISSNCRWKLFKLQLASFMEADLAALQSAILKKL
jgi:hypothetical protein